ncbi:calcium/sodium antiporter [Aliiglaciecola sp. CAU 1673]|uniref:calcium/sodium antiporter n=1 Tax=Aliiglaciecola sp. CAU 1673 TaxID=3032595 RepID=UPI0023DC166A|nr:calcium/sodium antiporter [Aliiglaciecola sp. CAU 1673]MDF2180354.1 calcium/sodium antiporter [Aliiglaciecola sp. CAU 1673]
MLLSALAILGGFALLIWSADRFVDGAAATAKHAGLPPLLIGMVIVGFGTSAPEMVVSAMAAMDDNPDLALGNALGSNIVNIGLILGVTALIAPMAVHSNIIRKELPILLGISLFAGFLFWDGSITSMDAGLLLGGFFLIVGWSIFSGLKNKGDAFETEMQAELQAHAMPLKTALLWLVVGLVLLVASSRLLVWGAVEIASALGVSDLIIGLTIVALGTSLPELASSIVAARKGEHDIAIGNIVGSNMFNLLAVVGIAGAIAPMPSLAAEVISRDYLVMLGLTIILLVMALGKPGRINRVEGASLVGAYAAYTGYLIYSITAV